MNDKKCLKKKIELEDGTIITEIDKNHVYIKYGTLTNAIFTGWCQEYNWSFDEAVEVCNEKINFFREAFVYDEKQ